MGKKFKAGDKVLITRPEDRDEGPQWVPEMDYLDGIETEVTQYSQSCGWVLTKAGVSEHSSWGDFQLDERWLTLVEQGKESCDLTPPPSPKNNDGRTSCFWCQVDTQKRGGGMYDVCPKCGR